MDDTARQLLALLHKREDEQVIVDYGMRLLIKAIAHTKTNILMASSR